MSTINSISLPTFDISEFEEGNKYIRNSIRDSLSQCLQDHGFFSLSGHGIPDSLLSEVLLCTRRFFALPIELKKLYSCPASSAEMNMAERGYAEREFYGKNPVEDSPLDLNEGFIVGKDITLSQARQLNSMIQSEYYTQNIWPSIIPEMKELISTYYEEIRCLSLRLRVMIENVLGFSIPECGESTSLMRLNYYPQVNDTPLPNQWRISPHPDYCMFTILLPEPRKHLLSNANSSKGELEVYHKEKGWSKVIYNKSSFVINCGHTLQELSSGKCVSSMHRVSCPVPTKEYDNSRVSIAYFVHADYLIEQETLKTYENLIKKSQEVLS